MELVSSQSAFTLKMFQAMFYSSCRASFIYKIDELRKRKGQGSWTCDLRWISNYKENVIKIQKSDLSFVINLLTHLWDNLLVYKYDG